MKKSNFFLYVFFFFCFLGSVHALSFAQNPTIYSPIGNFTRLSQLVCGFSATDGGAFNANLTWYRNDVLYAFDDETLAVTSGVAINTSGIGSIEALETAKNQRWRCSVQLYNATASLNFVNSSQVTIINSPPQVNALANQSVYEDSAFGPIFATATDIDGDSFVWFSGDLNASYYGSSLFTIAFNGAITFTPTNTQVGNHSMAISASDGSATGGIIVNFEVLPVNDAPIFTNANSFSCTEGSLCSFTFTATDEENNFPLTFYDNTSLFTLASVSNTSGSFSFTPIFAQTGVHNITIFVNDSLNASTNMSFVLNISAINHVPSVGILNNTNGTQGSLFTAYINASDLEINDTLIFNVVPLNCSFTNPWSIVTVNNTSTNGLALINLTLNNSHVACNTINITVSDFDGIVKSTTGSVFTLNITNTNDAPVIHRYSYYSVNTNGNSDIENVSAPNGITSFYRINATDGDMYTYEGDNLTFSINDTLSSMIVFYSNNGTLAITPNQSMIGNYLLNVFVNDSYNATDSYILNLTVVNNTVPVLDPIANITCFEDVACSTLLNATDLDGDALTFATNNSIMSFTSYNSSSALFNTTFTQDAVGVYTILVRVYDSVGAQDTQVITLTIVNVNEAPFFDNQFDNVSDTVTFPLSVTNHITTFYVNVTDFDLAVDANENITFNATITSGPNLNLFSIVKLSNNQARIQFSPIDSDIGYYNLTLRVTDNYNLYTEQNVTFRVYNVSVPPVISSVRPYLNETNMTVVYGSFGNTASFSNMFLTNVSANENETITFDVQVTDVDSADENISIRWYYDGVLEQSTQLSVQSQWIQSFNFFSSGMHNVTVVAADNLFGSTNFTFLVNVSNVNRAPILLTQYPDLNITTNTIVVGDALRFLDPDDDLNSNTIIDNNETNTLSYSFPTSTYVSVNVSLNDFTYIPIETGSTFFSITANDSDGLSLISNNFTIEVNYVPPSETNTVSQVSSKSGGGGGSARAVSVPKPKIVIEYTPLDILTPKPITLYENETVKAPIEIVNKGDVDLHDIFLSATAEVKGVTITIDNSYFALLKPDERRDATIIIENYRSEGTYEIYVNATVADPEFSDSAIIYINSVEKGEDDEGAVNTKIAFARDLVSTNQQCIELNEILDQANALIKQGKLEEAQKAISGVIEGCKYLVAQKEKFIEEPSKVSLKSIIDNKYLTFALFGALLVLITGIIVLFIKFKELDKLDV